MVDEGLREHAGEFAAFSGIADLIEHVPADRIQYSEKFAWTRKQFDPINQSLAQYHKVKPAWMLLQAMAGGIDGRRSLAHAALVRRYMDNCGTWRSCYRFVLAVVQEMATSPVFSDADLRPLASGPSPENATEAIWDVLFTRLSGLQEYGFHAGLERLMWATDELNGRLAALDLPAVHAELQTKSVEWTDLIIRHATQEGAFFPAQAAWTADESECV